MIRRLAMSVVVALAFGCEAQLIIEQPNGPPPGREPPVVWLDGGSDTATGNDTATPDTSTLGGCTHGAMGECDGTVARWCEGETARSESCASGCAFDSSLGRVACTESPPPVVGCDDPVEQEVIMHANAARASVGLGPLSCDPDMTRAARLHSQDMCDRGYFSHNSLDGRSPFDRMRDEGVTFRTAGENIAAGQPTASSVHQSWMNSTGHRANILNGSFGRIGVGYAPCGGSPRWTQNFAD